MANNKMLIDASHPEETRVVVVRGNRVEEFDFEAQERRQLRGNIYLAKVTRVEPSLQAAFIDYGGNRHGFLAFSEIHPDYYQIPAADRQALLEAEAAEAARDSDDGEDVSVVDAVGEDEETSDNGDNGDADKPTKRSRRKPRRGGRTRKADTDQNSSDAGNDEAGASEETDKPDNSEATSDKKTAEAADSDGDEEKPKKPKRRTRRSKKAEPEAETAEAPDTAEAAESDGEAPTDGDTGKTMAAMMEMDTISEPAPDDDDGGDDDSDNDGNETTADAADEEKPAKKTTRRKAPARKKAAKADKEKAAEVDSEVTAEAAEAKGEEGAEKDSADEEAAPKKTRKPAKSKRSPRKKSKAAETESQSEEGASDDAKGKSGKDAKGDGKEENGSGEKVESVGQEDAMEEVSVRRPRRQYKIQEVIRRRQVMLVQVVKEERGNKGAALTTYLSLAGRYSVLMPNTARGGGISRKITNPGDRKRLKEIANSLDVPQGMGVILRTAGASRDKDEITRDFEYLMRLWENVRNLTLESSAPFLVYEEGSLIKRSIRDLYDKNIGEIIVAGEEGYEEARNFMQMMMPEHVKNIKLYKGEQSLLSKFNVESQLEKMVAPQVTLKSGGYLIINQTEALVAIDVNSGRSTREHSIEATALQTNMEAAEEVARQLRLRDLAGLVVIDFIDMEEKRNNRAVERKLKDCLKNDRARIQVGHISHFGLLEMSRQRIRASVLESTMAACPVCEGTGHVRSESSFAIHVLRAIDDHLNRNSRFDVVVKVAPSTAMFILNHKRQAVSELEERYGVVIEFVGDYLMQVQDFEIEKGGHASGVPDRKKAVNPMHGDSDDADEKDASDEGDRVESSDDDSDEDGGRKRGRRRRGRGRNRGRDRDAASPDDNDGGKKQDESEDQEDTAPENDAARSDDKPEVKEKPSKGRKRSKAADDADADKAAAPAAEEKPEEPREPRRRTGRPGKKVKPEANADDDAVAKDEAPSTGPAGAPPRKVERRNTRRVRKPREAESGSDSEETPESFSGGFLG